MTDAELIWRSKSDEALADAAAALGDFTEEGEQIIRAELRRRGLPDPPPPIGQCARCHRSIHGGDPGDECAQCGEPFTAAIRSALLAAAPNRPGERPGHGDDLIAVATFPNLLEASLAKSALAAAGIEALVPGEDAGRLSTGLLSGPYASVRVRLSDYERARDVLEDASRR